MLNDELRVRIACFPAHSTTTEGAAINTPS
jgi:hypothetical protein